MNIYRIETMLVDLLQEIEYVKPNDRSEKDRAFAILKTDLEKCLAWYLAYCQ